MDNIPKNYNKGLYLTLKFNLVLLLLITNMYASVEAGKDVYLTNCANCHSINMSGSLGKDFNLVSYTRTKEEIIDYAIRPEILFKEFGYSSNAMPRLPLTGKELEDIADYIDSLQPFKKWMLKSHKNQ